MAQAVCVVVFAADRAPLAAIVADRNQRQKHVARARIGLASADRGSAQRVAQSIAQLVQAIRDFTEAYNRNAAPFVWRKREVKGAQLRKTIVNLRN
jgi:hypothetical protein